MNRNLLMKKNTLTTVSVLNIPMNTYVRLYIQSLPVCIKQFC